MRSWQGGQGIQNLKKGHDRIAVVPLLKKAWVQNCSIALRSRSPFVAYAKVYSLKGIRYNIFQDQLNNKNEYNILNKLWFKFQSSIFALVFSHAFFAVCRYFILGRGWIRLIWTLRFCFCVFWSFEKSKRLKNDWNKFSSRFRFSKNRTPKSKILVSL